MSDFPILSMVTFLPLLGAGIIMALSRGTPEETAAPARYMALWTSLITFLLSLFLWFDFDRGTADFQFVEQVDWMPGFNISYHVGVDGISLLFVLLSTLLTPLCVICSWSAIQTRVKEFMIAFLVLETLMIGMFCALDFVLFYMFYEAVLILARTRWSRTGPICFGGRGGPGFASSACALRAGSAPRRTRYRDRPRDLAVRCDPR